MDLKDEFYIYVGKKRSICEDPTISNDRIVFTPPLPADDLELEEVLVCSLLSCIIIILLLYDVVYEFFF